jgi:replicative DNA helicase
LKNLARELDVPVIVLSQLNRDVENRESHKPRLADLRESGAIEQDADVVVLLMRKEYYNPKDEPGAADVNVAKQRNGPTDEFKLAFDKVCARFDDISFLSYVDEEVEEVLN